MGEGLKEMNTVVWAHPYPSVEDFTGQDARLAFALEVNPQVDLPTVGVFHRVTDQIKEDLSQAIAIDQQLLWKFWLDHRADLEPLGVGSDGLECHKIFKRPTYVHWRSPELKVSGLHL